MWNENERFCWWQPEVLLILLWLFVYIWSGNKHYLSLPCEWKGPSSPRLHQFHRPLWLHPQVNCDSGRTPLGQHFHIYIAGRVNVCQLTGYCGACCFSALCGLLAWGKVGSREYNVCGAQARPFPHQTGRLRMRADLRDVFLPWEHVCFQAWYPVECIAFFSAGKKKGEGLDSAAGKGQGVCLWALELTHQPFSSFLQPRASWLHFSSLGWIPWALSCSR